MNLHQQFATENECYHVNRKMKPIGIMVHSTGCNNPYLWRYVQPDDGLIGVNKWKTDFNICHPGGMHTGYHRFVSGINGKCAICGGRQSCVHAWIGKLKDESIATYQTLPWDICGWHSGAGKNGNANFLGYIGFEICEDDLADSTYFNAVYKEAVELCVYLCKMFDLTADDIICHSEGFKLGIASNHSDVTHWFPKHGKSMDTLRADVREQLNNDKQQEAESKMPSENAEDWAQGAWIKAYRKGTLDGTMPHEPLTREQFALVLDRLGLLE